MELTRIIEGCSARTSSLFYNAWSSYAAYYWIYELDVGVFNPEKL